ncbi:TolB amino-terminal domain-containing protein [Rhizobium sp. NFR07]|uniref:hypothetical protein n=1 Tax=Rhizobium sp. NFR07 TaxID=1566262 RepID=UPI0008F2AFAD|nr:hypothetical protein [Rhizobium sp. NFR07]SFA82016.1 TolB amino-terminal domain-containing protein [Rhizobium sp. NFR07]
MESARSNGHVASEPSETEVETQLDRILACESVHLPERARNFLRFVVMETLAGRSHFLKAYTIADVVFGRKNFDAQSDPAVRIEAGRIRRELERYYLMAGPNEPVIITIPKGGYVPTFKRSIGFTGGEGKLDNPAGSDVPAPPEESVKSDNGALRPGVTQHWLGAGGLLAGAVLLLGTLVLLPSNPVEPSLSEGSGRPTVAVDLFDHPEGDKDLPKLSQGITDEIIAKLVKFNEIQVIEAQTGAEGTDQKLSRTRYVLQGTLRKEGNRIRSSVRLVRRSDGTVIWASNYDTDLSVQDVFEAETAVAEMIATAVAQPFGVLFQSSMKSPPGWEAYDCALSYYNYRRAITQPTLAVAQACLSALTRKFPQDATSLAFLAITHLDQVRFAYKFGTPPSAENLETASQLAERAAGIDPRNARALQAVMLTSFFRHDIDAALAAGAASYAINPNDTEVAGEYGLRLSMSGNWDTGCNLVSNAVSKDAGPKGYYEVGLALCAFMKGDLQAAELWSRMSDLDYNPMHRMVLMSILGASGKTAQARQELDWLNANAPTLMRNIRQEITTRLARQEDQEKILSGLRAGGAIIDEAAASK